MFAGLGESVVPPTLALEFVATRGSLRGDADRFQRHRIVAALATGEILLEENIVQQVDVVGSVSGNSTQGPNSLECDPEATVALPYAEATVVGGNTAFADANGQFTIPHGGATPVTVRSRLRGQWFEVFDDTMGGAFGIAILASVAARESGGASDPASLVAGYSAAFELAAAFAATALVVAFVVLRRRSVAEPAVADETAAVAVHA